MRDWKHVGWKLARNHRWVFRRSAVWLSPGGGAQPLENWGLGNRVWGLGDDSALETPCGSWGVHRATDACQGRKLWSDSASS